MKDFLEVLEEYKNLKDIKDLANEIKRLRELYYSKDDEQMSKHINQLTQKYLVETFTWNLENPIIPQTFEQQFLNAENFLKA